MPDECKEGICELTAQVQASVALGSLCRLRQCGPSVVGGSASMALTLCSIQSSVQSGAGSALS